METKIALFVLVTGLAFGCAHRDRGGGGGGRAAPRASSAEPRGDWRKLGERWVDGARDRDVIAVGAREGAYRRIMIVVEHSPLEMYDVTVHFTDGGTYSPATRHVFGANTHSHVIDLPGSRRTIRSVEFRYGNLPGHGRAQAELWAD
jgi:hypothetical protein